MIEAANETWPTKPDVGATVTVELPVEPLATSTYVAFTVNAAAAGLLWDR